MKKDCQFAIVGNSTELSKLLRWKEDAKPCFHQLCVDSTPPKKYDELVREYDVGMICLDYRFTTPNYQSRILSYLENKCRSYVLHIPILI